MAICWPSVRARKLRATRSTACGDFPVPGTPNSMLVTDGFISIDITPVYEGGDEFIQKNANGELCINDRSCDVPKRLELVYTFCNVDPDLISLFTGAPLNVDAAGQSTGFQWTESMACVDFSTETWTGIPGASCGVNEVQSVTEGGAGLTSFTLTYSGQTTASIPAGAAASAVQAALIALSNIGGGDVSVTGPDGGPYIVTFQGALAHTNVAQMTSTPTGGTGTVTVATLVTGSGTGTASGYFLLPHVTNGTLQNFTLENGAATFVINAWTKAPSAWGVGPYNVVAGGALGVPSSLIDPVLTDAHMFTDYVTVEPPEASCGLQVMPSAPTPAA